MTLTERLAAVHTVRESGRILTVPCTRISHGLACPLCPPSSWPENKRPEWQRRMNNGTYIPRGIAR